MTTGRADPEARALLDATAAALRSGQPDVAEKLCRKLLEIAPDLAPVHRTWGFLLQQTGRLTEALAAFERAAWIRPDDVAAHFNRGVVLERQGRLEQALAAYDEAVRLKPDFAQAHFGRGIVLRRRGRLDEALDAYDRALQINPDDHRAHIDRGAVLRQQGRLEEALAAYDQALRIQPNDAWAHNNRGNVLAFQGQFREAAAAYEKAVSLKPDFAEADSNRLFCLTYDPAQDDGSLFAAHRKWGELHGHPANAYVTHANARDPAKTLRVGLVSADLGRHPVGYLVEPVLVAVDPAEMQIVCYSDRRIEDDLTERLKAKATGWRSTLGVADAALAETVRADGIDILVDLAGHTLGNRMRLFTLKPAPVQVSWIGYPYTTGLPAIDYTLMDEVVVPPGDERWFVERVVRLPDTRFCYAPPEYGPAPEPPPALKRGFITFGSFNNLLKVTPSVIELWARVLDAVPHARLLLKWATLSEPETEARYRCLIGDLGVDPARVELRGASPHRAMLAEYADVDIALDPLPYSGGVTSLEALWQGVPVVTLPESRPVSRQSQAFLTALGRTEWIARDADDYVRIAADLASNLDRLADLRRDQRSRMAASPLCDAPRYARNFEAALRWIWRRWCKGQSDTITDGGRSMDTCAPTARTGRLYAAAATARSFGSYLAAIACSLAFVGSLPSPLLAEGPVAVKSLLEMRHERVVIQDWDLSCGAAALATLLNYQHGDPVSEREIAEGLIERQEYIANPLLVRARHGFSLLDLKRYVDERGYQAIGYGQLTLADLVEQAPIMVPVNFLSYNHFVVFRGMRGNRVLLADPAFGNRTMHVAKFEAAWLEYEEFGKVGFVVALADGTESPNRLAPAPADFVSLR
jgi:protein O-GlcNAc transferase